MGQILSGDQQKGNQSSDPTNPGDPFTPRVLSMPEPDKYLLGGKDGLLRSIKDYKVLLGKVAMAKCKDASDSGRILCGMFLREEFTKDELAEGNITGTSREKETHRITQITKLNPVVMDAIFCQAQHQFPGFTDAYTLKGPNKTVAFLNNICRRIRYELGLQSLLYPSGN